MLKSATFLVKVFKNALKLSDSQRDAHCTLREHYPLQQGLRHPRTWMTAYLRSQRALSITTRIKTFFVFFKMFHIGFLREHYPLQQGLRHVL